MKGNLKKTLAIALAAMMSAAALASCGGSDAGSSKADSSTPASTASDSGNKDIVTLKVLTPESDNTYLKLAERENYPVWQALEQRMTDHGVAVELEIVPRDQYKVTIQTRMASANDLPDFANLSELDDTTRLNLANQGILLPINEILEQGDGTAKDFMDNETAFVKGLCTAADGNMYWISIVSRSTYGGELGSTCKVIAIRQDWLDKVGMSVPTTAEEFRAALKAFQEQDVNGSGVADEVLAFDPSTFANGISQWFGLGAKLTSVDLTNNKVVSPWYQDGVKDYFKYLNQLVNDGTLDTALIGATTSDLQDQKMAENKVAATYTYATQSWLEPSVNADTEVYYQPIAALKAVDGIEPAIAIQSAETIVGAWGFTKACTDQKAAAALLDSFWCAEAADLETWGIEGLTYEVVDGKKQYFPGIDNAHWEECAKNGTAKGDWLWGNAAFPKIRFAAMETEIEERGGGKAEFQKAIIGHQPSFPMSNTCHLALPTAEQLERKSELKTDLETYSKELATQLILGQASLDDWDSYMAELKDLGLDEILEIENDQLVRFNDAVGK